MEQTPSPLVRRIFIKLDMTVLGKSVEKIQLSLQSDKNNGHFTCTPTSMYVYDKNSVNSFYNEKYFRQNLYRKSKHIFYFYFFSPENRAVYEIMWKNRYSQTGHRHTLRICNTYCCSTATMVMWTRLNITLYVHCLSCLTGFNGATSRLPTADCRLPTWPVRYVAVHFW
jgi:hypothetical protein